MSNTSKTEDRDAALMDLQYDAGARAGFAAGEEGDYSFIDKLDRRVAGAAGALKVAVAAAEAAVQQGSERDAALTPGQLDILRFAAEMLDGCDCEDVAGDVREIISAMAAPLGEKASGAA